MSPAARRAIDAFILVACSGMLLTGMLLRERDGSLQLGGEAVPGACWVSSVLPHGCPGCGLTRSVVSLCHLRFEASMAFHPAGVLVVALLVLQIGYRGARLVGSERLRTWVPRASACALAATLTLSVARWLFELCL